MDFQASKLKMYAVKENKWYVVFPVVENLRKQLLKYGHQYLSL